MNETKKFYLQDMPFHTIASCANAGELASALKRAPDIVVAHHMRSNVNDFAEWVEHGLGDKKLARKLRGVKLELDFGVTKEKIIRILEDSAKKAQKLGDNPLEDVGGKRGPHPFFRA